MVETTEREFDVAVVGGAAMGSFAAERMARAGLDVALFEKDALPGDSTVCAGGLHHDLVKFLDLPLTIVEKVLPRFAFTVNGRRAEWSFDEPTYATVERRNLDRCLAARAVRTGVQLYTGARVVRVEPAKETLYYQSSQGDERIPVHARVFVFADGPDSLAHRLSVPSGQRKERLQWVALEYDLAAPANELDTLEIIPNAKRLPFGYYWVFPKRDHVNVGLGRLNSIKGPHLHTLLDEFIADRPDLRGMRQMRRKAGVIPAQPVSVLQQDNWLTIGDAAGMVNPLTGGGYVCGFVSAGLAARTCIEAFANGRFRPEILKRYGSRLRMTKHYVAARLMRSLLTVLMVAHRRAGLTLWIPVQRLYFAAVHLAMRFVSVL